MGHKVACGVLAAGLVLAGCVAGGAIGFAVGRASAPGSAAQEHTGPSAGAAQAPFTARAADGSVLFGLNDSGQYFGTEGYAVEYLAGRLDLIACIGIDGEFGYCYYDDLPGGDEGSVAPELYASDGETVLGRFAAVDANVDGNYPPGEAEFCATGDSNGSVLFGLNTAGQYYSADDFGDVYLRGDADLIAAVGSGGTSGYVLRSDLEAAFGGEVPVYESDGVTVVDTLSL